MRRLIRSEFRKLTTTKMPLALLGVLILFAIINAFIVIAFASNGFILAALFGAIAVSREDGNHTVIPTFFAELAREQPILRMPAMPAGLSRAQVWGFSVPGRRATGGPRSSRRFNAACSTPVRPPTLR